jgi:protoheme IX farnesyltransferase
MKNKIYRKEISGSCPIRTLPTETTIPRSPAIPNVFELVRTRSKDYLLLTKPKIMLLVLVTGATALVIEGSMVSQPWSFLLFLLGLYLTGGAANAFNQYFERDIDARMTRTRKRRPLPQGAISATEAVVFSAVIGILGLALLWWQFNLLTGALAFGTMVFYSLFYTLWLKPNTSQNIVIGGIAGAMAPVGAWAAATGGTAVAPWIMFAVVFLWTPPHFWSLALCFRDDYEKTRLPMMPVIKGVDSTHLQITVYSILLAIVSLAYGFYGGWIYMVAAIVLGSRFVFLAVNARRHKDHRATWSLFTYSILYLFGLFATMIADKLILG